MSLLQRIAEKDKIAIVDCLNIYGNFIWTMARKCTVSAEEAEKATRAIFADVWQHAEHSKGKVQSSEKLIIAALVRRRLVKTFTQQVPSKSNKP